MIVKNTVNKTTLAPRENGPINAFVHTNTFNTSKNDPEEDISLKLELSQSKTF